MAGKKNGADVDESIDSYMVMCGKTQSIPQPVVKKLIELATRRGVSLNSFVNMVLYDKVQSTDLAHPEIPKFFNHTNGHEPIQKKH